jgi:hypothetical protein
MEHDPPTVKSVRYSMWALLGAGTQWTRYYRILWRAVRQQDAQLQLWFLSITVKQVHVHSVRAGEASTRGHLLWAGGDSTRGQEGLNGNVGTLHDAFRSGDLLFMPSCRDSGEGSEAFQSLLAWRHEVRHLFSR